MDTKPHPRTADIAERLHARKSGAGWSARCPAHEDRNASLSISEGNDGRTLLHCHAGCKVEAIVTAAGLSIRDLMPDRTPTLQKRVEAIYDYNDAAGVLLFQVVRYVPKDFRQRRPDRTAVGGWTWNLTGVSRVLYRLPEVLTAVAAGRVVFCVEGEKDADALAGIGEVATCNSGGAGKWADGYAATLTGARVVILPDKDAPGRAHAALVTRALTGKAESVRVVELPDRDGRRVKDAADWIAAGGTAEELHALLASAPAWTPPPDTTPSHTPASAPSGDAEGIRARLWEIAQQPKLTPTERHRAAAAAVVEWLHVRGRFYYHAERRDFASVMYFDASRKLLLPVQGDAFTAWLSDALAVNRHETTFKYALAAVETEGLTERATGIEPAAFWAATATAFYLSNGPGRMVRVAAGQVEAVDNGTDGVLFPYGATLPTWQLTEPADPFEACALFRDASAQAEHGRMLFLLWAIGLPSNQRTKPPLVLSGTVGSGKTRLARGVFELYGLPPRIAAILKNGEGDFWAAMDAGGLACFDNADTRVDWLPDALAAAATAGTLEKRRLYTDADRVSLRAKSWVCVTSASPSFAADAGLADRLLVVRLGRREGATAEGTLSDEITAARDAGLSWIAHTLAAALADTGDVPDGLNARHPDFARLAVKIGRAIGRGDEAVAALRAAEADKGLFNLENDNVGAALLDLLRVGPFNGTAAELLTALLTVDPSLEGRLSGKGLGKRLSKLWPHLAAVFHAEQERDGHTGAWRYSFRPPSVAVFAYFQEAKTIKSGCSSSRETFPKTAFERQQTPQTTPPDLFEEAATDTAPDFEEVLP